MSTFARLSTFSSCCRQKWSLSGLAATPRAIISSARRGVWISPACYSRCTRKWIDATYGRARHLGALSAAQSIGDVSASKCGAKLSQNRQRKLEVENSHISDGSPVNNDVRDRKDDSKQE